MKGLFLNLFLCLIAINVINAQSKDPKDTEVWEPEPRVITPGEGAAAPSDAIVLLKGDNLDEWVNMKGETPQWTRNGDHVTVKPRTGPIKSKRTFEDFQLHIEWSAPTVVKGEGQGRGNSGVFLQERYEVQVLDSYNNRTYSNGQAGSLYKQSIPLVNAMRAPGQWNTYDIIYKAPRFNKDGIKVSSAYVTVIHNGVVIQNNTEIKGTTEYIGQPKNIAHGKGSIMLQDHGDLVRYRNIWIREL